MGTPQPIKCEREFEISLSSRLFVYIGFTFANLFCLFALYKIYAKAKSDLLIKLTGLLIITNTASCLWQYADYNYNVEKCSSDA